MDVVLRYHLVVGIAKMGIYGSAHTNGSFVVEVGRPLVLGAHPTSYAGLACWRGDKLGSHGQLYGATLAQGSASLLVGP